jgi:hypothetical protein
MAARVEEDEDFRPLAVSLEGTLLAVVSIDERVEEEAEWWEPEPLFTMHYQVTLEDGHQVTIFRNMKPGHGIARDDLADGLSGAILGGQVSA